MTNAMHEFESTDGDEMSVSDLRESTWKVVETYVDLDLAGQVTFTHRIELHSVDAEFDYLTPD